MLFLNYNTVSFKIKIVKTYKVFKKYKKLFLNSDYFYEEKDKEPITRKNIT